MKTNQDKVDINLKITDTHFWHSRLKNWGLNPKYKQIAKIVFLIFVLFTFLVSGELYRQQTLRRKASGESAQLFFKPSSGVVNEATSIEIWANANQPVNFARVTIKFDPTVINLTEEIIPNPILGRTIMLTPSAEANVSGIARFVLGLDPTQKNSPPNGTFKLADLKVIPKTTANNVNASLILDNQDVQLVSNAALTFTLSSFTNANLILNSATSSPTNDIIAPNIVFTKPANEETLPAKGNVKVNVAANDSSGISKIEIFLDDQLKHTCTDSTTCSYGFKTGRLNKGSHTLKAKAIDNSINKNWAQTSITVIVP